MAEDSPPKKLNIMSRNTNDENSLDSQSASETGEKEMTSRKKDDKKTSENEAKAVRISRRQKEKRDKGGRSNKSSKEITKESGKRKNSLDSEKRNVKPKVESKLEAKLKSKLNSKVESKVESEESKAESKVSMAPIESIFGRNQSRRPDLSFFYVRAAEKCRLRRRCRRQRR